jgi:hypothetical protein
VDLEADSERLLREVAPPRDFVGLAERGGKAREAVAVAELVDGPGVHANASKSLDSLQQEVRDDVPIAEMRLYKSDFADGAPYTKSGREKPAAYGLCLFVAAFAVRKPRVTRRVGQFQAQGLPFHRRCEREVPAILSARFSTEWVVNHNAR